MDTQVSAMPSYMIRIFRPAEPLAHEPRTSLGFAPPTDVAQTADGLLVRMELAGVSPASVEILVAEDGRLLTISGDRPHEANDGAQRYLNLEIPRGRFGRRIPLPAEVDAHSAQASYTDGFLVIRLPWKKPTVRRSITVTG
jgi:HSP20 family protein